MFPYIRKAKFRCIWLILRRKTVVVFVPFHWFYQKQLFPSNQNIPQDLPLFNLFRKNNFLSNSKLLSELVTFWTQKMFSVNFRENAIKLQKSLFTVCDTFLGRKQFLAIFVMFTGLTKNSCFYKIKIFLRIFLFSNLLRKNTLSNSKLLSESKFLYPKDMFSVNFRENTSKYQKSFV